MDKQSGHLIYPVMLNVLGEAQTETNKKSVYNADHVAAKLIRDNPNANPGNIGIAIPYRAQIRLYRWALGWLLLVDFVAKTTVQPSFTILKPRWTWQNGWCCMIPLQSSRWVGQKSNDVSLKLLSSVQFTVASNINANVRLQMKSGVIPLLYHRQRHQVWCDIMHIAVSQGDYVLLARIKSSILEEASVQKNELGVSVAWGGRAGRPKIIEYQYSYCDDSIAL